MGVFVQQICPEHRRMSLTTIVSVALLNKPRSPEMDADMSVHNMALSLQRVVLLQ